MVHSRTAYRCEREERFVVAPAGSRPSTVWPLTASSAYSVVVRGMTISVLIVDFLVLTALLAVHGRGVFQSALFNGALAFMPFAIAAVILAQKGRLELGAHLTTGGVFVNSWLFMVLHLNNPQDPYVLMGIAYTPFLAGLLLPWPWAAGYALATLAGVSLLRGFAPFGELVTANVFLFAGVFGMLTVWAAVARDQWAKDVLQARADMLRRSQELDAVFEGSHDGQAFMEKDGTILQANDRFAQILDMRSIARGTAIQKILPGSLLGPFLLKVGHCMQEGYASWNFQVGPEGMDGRDVDGVLVRIDHSESPPMLLLSLRDVSGKKAAERAQEEAVQAARKNALNLISHHLRTPVTPLRLDLFALRARGSNLTDPQKALIERMERDLRRLTSMLDLLVDASQAVESQDVKRQWCDLQELLEQAIAAKADLAPIQNDAVDSASVLSDPVGLRVALGVLLERLDKSHVWRAWTERAPGFVKLNFSTGEPSGDEVRVEVGEPFSADTNDPVFRDQLAMFVVRSTVEANGGRFDAYASPTGQRVCMSLPSAAG